MAVSKRLRFEVFRRDNHACRYCGRSAPDVKLTIDHVVPVALGGRDDPSNIVTACADCNGGKSATPPDAAVVDDVASDAVRWARARRMAADQLVANLAARDDARAAFLDEWNRWEATEKGSRRKVPLDDGWEQSVDGFLAAGLPLEVLIDCVEKAMRAKKVAVGNRFRYMCGVAWRTVGELDEATRAALDPDDDDRQFPDLSRTDLEERVMRWELIAEHFLRELPVWVHERAERGADHDWECAGEPDAPRGQKLPDVVRHVAGVLKDCKVEPVRVAVD